MKKYISGLDMAQFKHIEEISCYNNNYFVGFDKDLLFAESDDDNTTEWYLINGSQSVQIGYSLTSENDKFHRWIRH